MSSQRPSAALRSIQVTARGFASVFRALCVVLAALRPSPRTRRQLLRAIRRTPVPFQVAIAFAFTVLIWLSVNWVYQVVRKPSELFFPISGSLARSPAELWRAHRADFRAHSTSIITPTFLAALAHLESGGDPMARTYWRWQFSWNPLRWYMPASSAVGMYQVIDGTFEQMRRYCIHDHVVVESGRWYDPRACWFNALYMRALPSHSIELTSAYLDRQVRGVLARTKRRTTPAQRLDLAAVIHLCGLGVGQTYAARGFGLQPEQRCGSHSVAGYLTRLHALQSEFARIAQ